jgi:succinyl-CoA synthetase beta subunit
MNLHEYQAKMLLQKNGVPVPAGKVVESPEAACEAADELGYPVMIKIQVHAGGRGKAGGIQKAENTEEVKKIAAELLGRVFKTAQTGSQGRPVEKLLIEPRTKIKKEYYVGITIDRFRSQCVMAVSSEGGVDIEEIAKNHPDRLITEPVNLISGFQPAQGKEISKKLGLSENQAQQFSAILSGAYETFMSSDASTVEINPLAEMEDGSFKAIDGKIVIDDNALYLYPDIANMRDPAQEEAIEIEAKKHGLSYIKMDGEIGCMINGAGLAMATLDIITLHGMSPANFLDVGGSASSEQVQEAFQIILSDKRVKAVFVNIFGGIMQCERIAEGIISAAKNIKLQVPLVVRLEGTHVDLGRKLLAESGLAIISATGIEDGVVKLKELLK